MSHDIVLILSASTIRSFAIGALSVFFGLYLASLGLSEFQIGVVIAAGLAGMATGTLLTSLVADRLGRRKSFLTIAPKTSSKLIRVIIIRILRAKLLFLQSANP